MHGSIGFFLVAVIGTWSAMHYYAYRCLVSVGLDRGILIAALWALALLFPLVRVLTLRWRSLPLRIGYWIGAVWLAGIFVLDFWFLVGFALRRMLMLAGLGSYANPVIWAQAIAGAVLAMLVWGAFNAWRGPVDVHYQIDRSKRYGQGKRARIVQISDVHLGLTLGADFLERLVERINAQKPDLVLITGDLLDPEFPDDARAAQALRKLTPTHGTFAVSGNHEFYAGIPRFFALMEASGIPVLDNETRMTGSGIQVCGIHDPTAGSFTKHGLTSDLAKALGGVKPDAPTLLLAHQPKHLEPAAAARVDLIFSGHTHAGQIFPFRAVVRMRYRYIEGRYALGPDTDLIVNTGTGFWGPPMRLGTDSQIVVVDLAY